MGWLGVAWDGLEWHGIFEKIHGMERFGNQYYCMAERYIRWGWLKWDSIGRHVMVRISKGSHVITWKNIV